MVVRIYLKSNTSWLRESLYEVEDEILLYDEQLKDIMKNTRWYLENLEYMCEYRVRWKDYSLKSPTLPHEFVRK